MVLPGFPQAWEERVRPAEEQNLWAQHAPARKNREVLHHDRFEQRRHQLSRGHPLFLQAVYVSLGEHAAFACDVVQGVAAVSLPAQSIARDGELRA